MRGVWKFSLLVLSMILACKSRMVEFSRYSYSKTLWGRSEIELVFKDTFPYSRKGIISFGLISDSAFVTTILERDSNFLELFTSYSDFYGYDNLIKVDSSNPMVLEHKWFTGIETLIRPHSYKFSKNKDVFFVRDLKNGEEKLLFRKGSRDFLGSVYDGRAKYRFQYRGDTLINWGKNHRYKTSVVECIYEESRVGSLRGHGAKGNILYRVFYDHRTGLPIMTEFYTYNLLDKSFKMDTMIVKEIIKPL